MILRRDTRAPNEPLIELRHLSKRFTMHKEARRSFQEVFIHLLRHDDESETFWPVRDLSLTVHPGESMGIIGPNGAGKSTLLKLITGILEPTSGDILTRGRISSLLELGAGFHPDLTGRENIYLNGSIMGISRRQMRGRVDSIVDFAELGDFIDVPVKHYSSGMYVRLGFAVAIHTDPDLLIVDEVLAVGDASFQHKCMDSIQKFRAGGGTLLLVSHDLASIQSICQQALWLEHGGAQAYGKPIDVAMAYLNSVAQREQAAACNQRQEAAVTAGRWGTGKLQIDDVEFCDGEGHACSVFVEGSTIEIRLHYRANGRIEDPVFGLAIHHQNGTQVCGPNTRFSQYYIPYVEGEGQIVYRVPAVPLLEGAYMVSVAAVNRADTETYDYWDRAYSFRVYPGGSAERFGLVTLRGEWGRSRQDEAPATGAPAADAEAWALAGSLSRA